MVEALQVGVWLVRSILKNKEEDLVYSKGPLLLRPRVILIRRLKKKQVVLIFKQLHNIHNFVSEYSQRKNPLAAQHIELKVNQIELRFVEHVEDTLVPWNIQLDT